MSEAGLSPYPWNNKSWAEGVHTLLQVLYDGRLTIDPACANLLQEASGLTWNKGLTKNELGQADHACDCARAAAMEYWPTASSIFLG